MPSPGSWSVLAPWCQHNLKIKDHDLDAKLLNLRMFSWVVVSAFHSVCLEVGKEGLGSSNEEN